MTKYSLKLALIGVAAMSLSGCSIPIAEEPEPEPVQLQTQPAAPAQAATTPAKPKNRWAHVPIGNTGATEGGGPSGGDEDGGWG